MIGYCRSFPKQFFSSCHVESHENVSECTIIIERFQSGIKSKRNKIEIKNRAATLHVAIHNFDD